MKKKVLYWLAGILIAIQLIPYGSSVKEVTDARPFQFDSNQTKVLFDKACADCHSNYTKWPWYSNIAPISWAVIHHVDEGREHFNISTWGVQKKNKGNEAAEELEDGEMPLKSYLIMHPEANLTAEQTKQLINGLEKTFGKED